MTLLDVAVALALVAVLWWGPGWAVGWALGIGPRYLVVGAPLLGLGTLTVVGLWAGLAGVAWTAGSAAAGVAVLTLLARLVRFLVERRRRPGAPGTRLESVAAPATRRELLVVAAGVLVAVVVGVAVWWQATDGLRLVNQDWDIPWHANIVRLVAESHSWSTGVAGNFAYYDTVVDDAPIRSYPIAFHAALALVWPWSGTGVVELLGVVQMLVVAVQVPLSAALLAWTLVRRPVAAAFAAVVSVLLTSFPYDLLFRGPLVPFVVGLALLAPFLVLATYTADGRGWVGRGVAAGIGAVGLLGAHASVAVFAAGLLLAWLLVAVPWGARPLAYRLRGLVVVGATAVVLGGPLALELLGESGRVSEVDWPAYETVPQGFGEVLLLSHGNAQAQWVWAALGLAGVWVLVRRPSARWYLLGYGAVVLLAAETAGSDGDLVTRLTAFVYNDSWRLVGVATLLAAPVVAVGAQWAVDGVRVLVGGVPPSRARAASGAAAALAFAALAVVTVADAERAVNSLERQYRDGPTLSTAERALLSRVADEVPADAQVLNDACDGSVWMYALGGRMPMIRHFEIIPTDRQLLLLQRMHDLDDDADVQRAAAELGIEYVYVSEGWVRSSLGRPAGLDGLDDVDALTLVDEEGAARLYRVDWEELPQSARAELAEARRDAVRRPGVPGPWASGAPAPLAPQDAVCV